MLDGASAAHGEQVSGEQLAKFASCSRAIRRRFARSPAIACARITRF